MPIYKSPRYSVSLSEALHEAAVINPRDRVMLDCFEVWHVSFSDPIYIVDDPEDFLATKESYAVRDASTEVTFVRSYVQINQPEESDQAGTPEVSLSVQNVSGAFATAVRAARGSRVPWELVWRVYASDEPEAPAIDPPMYLYLTDVEYDPETATFKASFGDSSNTAVPRTTFKRRQYPNLLR